MRRWSSARRTCRGLLTPCIALLSQRPAAGMRPSAWKRRWRETSMRWRSSSARPTGRRLKPRSSSSLSMLISRYTCEFNVFNVTLYSTPWLGRNHSMHFTFPPICRTLSFSLMTPFGPMMILRKTLQSLRGVTTWCRLNWRSWGPWWNKLSELASLLSKSCWMSLRGCSYCTHRYSHTSELYGFCCMTALCKNGSNNLFRTPAC